MRCDPEPCSFGLGENSHAARPPKNSHFTLSPGELSTKELPPTFHQEGKSGQLHLALTLTVAVACLLFLQGWRRWQPALPCLTLVTLTGMCLGFVEYVETEPRASTSMR